MIARPLVPCAQFCFVTWAWGFERARFIRRQNLRRRQKMGVKPVKMWLAPRRFKPQHFFISRRFLEVYLFVSSIFTQSTIIHMYPALLFEAHISLNKAIKSQKMHCTHWIAFIDQAHVTTHVNSSYYFGFWCSQNGVKRIKSIDQIDAYTVGRCVTAR